MELCFDGEFISNFPKRPADPRKKNTENSLRFDIQTLDTPFPRGEA
jgi:hypothetical protein